MYTCVCTCICVCSKDIIRHCFVWLGLLMCTLIKYLGFMDPFLWGGGGGGGGGIFVFAPVQHN